MQHTGTLLEWGRDLFASYCPSCGYTRAKLVLIDYYDKSGRLIQRLGSSLEDPGFVVEQRDHELFQNGKLNLAKLNPNLTIGSVLKQQQYMDRVAYAGVTLVHAPGDTITTGTLWFYNDRGQYEPFFTFDDVSELVPGELDD